MLQKSIITDKIINLITQNDCNISKTKLQEQIFNILSEYKIELVDQYGDLDLEQYINLFLSSQKLEGLSEITLYNYELTLNHFKRCVRKAVIDINTSDMRIYLGQFDDLKSSTISTKIYIFKSFFGWLQKEDIINKNPMLRIKNPKQEQRLPKGLSVEELEIMRESCKTLRERALCEVLYATGCRLDEIVQANKNDVNFSQQCMRVIGKGDKERTVYLSFKAIYHLKKYLKSRTDTNIALFVGSKKPHNRLGRRSIQREIQNIAIRMNVDKHIHPHALRHTFASSLLNNGCDIATISQLLGHSQISTTQIYAVANDEFIRNEYKKYFAQ